MDADTTLLDVSRLSVALSRDGQFFEGVSGVDICMSAGEIFCLVGESGCGKSLTAKALLRLVPEGAHISGTVVFEGQDISALPESDMRSLRGRRISMIFQEPMTALNPVLRVGLQVMEPLRLHLGLSKKEAEQRCIELFTQVGIPAPQARLQDYPHQLSGGMRQRVMIAMALACSPSLLLADEPTTALDVTIQGQILELIKHLNQTQHMGVLLITHDLGVVAQMADTVGVMYAGQIVERAPAQSLFDSPLHPYTQGLMAAAPTVENRHAHRLSVITGSVPPLENLPAGCRFHPRCPAVMPQCREIPPPLCDVPRSDAPAAQTDACPKNASVRRVRCWLHTC